MISVYQLKSGFQKLLSPLMNGLHKAGVTPNQLTVAAIVLSAGLAVILYYHTSYPFFLLLVPIGLFVRMMLNALDGMMAKTYNLQSKTGEVLNESGDVLSDFFIACALFSFAEINFWLIIAFLFLSALNEFAGILAKVISGVRRYDGPMGKSDRALVIGVFCLVSFFTEIDAVYANSVFVLINLALVLSTALRLTRSLK